MLQPCFWGHGVMQQKDVASLWCSGMSHTTSTSFPAHCQTMQQFSEFGEHTSNSSVGLNLGAVHTPNLYMVPVINVHPVLCTIPYRRTKILFAFFCAVSCTSNSLLLPSSDLGKCGSSDIPTGSHRATHRARSFALTHRAIQDVWVGKPGVIGLLDASPI